jgi:hypothetical protein
MRAIHPNQLTNCSVVLRLLPICVEEAFMDDDRKIAKEEEVGRAADEPMGQDDEFEDVEELDELEEADEEMEEK